MGTHMGTDVAAATGIWQEGLPTFGRHGTAEAWTHAVDAASSDGSSTTSTSCQVTDLHNSRRAGGHFLGHLPVGFHQVTQVRPEVNVTNGLATVDDIPLVGGHRLLIGEPGPVSGYQPRDWTGKFQSKQFTTVGR